MTALTGGMATALASPHIVMFCAVELVLPGATVRLLDGPATLVINGDTFTGRDATYGALGGIEAITEGAGDEAPSVRLMLLPPTTAATADLIDETVHGSAVSIWIGAVVPTTGAVVADPYLLFSGEIDVTTLRPGKGARVLSIECVSAFEVFFEDDEGIRLTDAFHQYVWPGELGLEYVNEMARQLPWGQDAPTPQVMKLRGSQTATPFDLNAYMQQNFF